MSEAEFVALVGELSQKVNLFSEIWREDPSALLFGGTSRDFTYWLKRSLSGAQDRRELEKKIATLRALTLIDVRDFMGYQSDADVVTKKQLAANAKRYGLTAIDTVSPERLDPGSHLGREERLQGVIPVEKIILGAEGVASASGFGNGVGEIFRGKLSVQYPDPKQFAQTARARNGSNHPALLPLRFIRQLATQYYYEHGEGYPFGILDTMDKASAAKTREVIASAMADPKLAKLLQAEKFKKRMDRTVQKAFRSYTNPTAAKQLYEYFGADKLVQGFVELTPVNNYLFSTRPDPSKVESNLGRFRVKREAFFQRPDQHFPDGDFLHGTRTEEDFKSVLRTGVMPSENGAAGAGLYGVNRKDIAMASDHAHSPDRVVALKVSSGAKVVDIGKAEGKRVFSEFYRQYAGRKPYDDFCDAFGIDLLAFPYSGATAFVARNRDTLGQPTGVTRQILSFSSLLELARVAEGDEALGKLKNAIELGQFIEDEIAIAVETTPQGKKLIHDATDLGELLEKRRAFFQRHGLPETRSAGIRFLEKVSEFADDIHTKREYITFRDHIGRFYESGQSLASTSYFQRRVGSVRTFEDLHGFWEEVFPVSVKDPDAPMVLGRSAMKKYVADLLVSHFPQDPLLAVKFLGELAMDPADKTEVAQELLVKHAQSVKSNEAFSRLMNNHDKYRAFDHRSVAKMQIPFDKIDVPLVKWRLEKMGKLNSFEKDQVFSVFEKLNDSTLKKKYEDDRLSELNQPHLRDAIVHCISTPREAERIVEHSSQLRRQNTRELLRDNFTVGGPIPLLGAGVVAAGLLGASVFGADQGIIPRAMEGFSGFTLGGLTSLVVLADKDANFRDWLQNRKLRRFESEAKRKIPLLKKGDCLVGISALTRP